MELTEQRGRGAYFARRRDYVEGLATALQSLQDFDQILYARTYTTEEEFVRISDIIGNACYLDVTALPLAQVFKDVVKCVLVGEIRDGNIVPASLITDINRKRKIAPLFK